MSAGIYQVKTTGAGAISASVTVPSGRNYEINSITLKLSAAPTTSEAFTVTLNDKAGAAYDTLQYTIDLSAGSTVDLVWPGSAHDSPVIMAGGDSLDIAYTNTDAATYGLVVTVSEVY